MTTEQTRKSFLKYMIGGLLGFGAGATSIPFLKALAPDKERASAGRSIVDLSQIPPGDAKEAVIVAQEAFTSIPILIVHRTPEMIKLARANDGGKDPQPDSERVVRPEWLIVSSVCTHLGCPVTWEPESAEEIKRLIAVLNNPASLDAADEVDDEPRKDATKLDKEIEAARAPLMESARAMQGLAGSPLVCRCHGAFFDYSGRVIKGPAKTNLPIPNVKFLSDTKVEISIPSKL